MGAVAKRRIASVLAAAKECRLGPLGSKHQWFDAGAFMRTIAKGLLFAPSAATPGVASAGLELDLIGAELRSLWL